MLVTMGAWSVTQGVRAVTRGGLNVMLGVRIATRHKLKDSRIQAKFGWRKWHHVFGMHMEYI